MNEQVDHASVDIEGSVTSANANIGGTQIFYGPVTFAESAAAPAAPEMLPALPRHIRIFLSSPGDVADERAIAFQVFDQLPYDPLLRGRLTLEVVAWDKPGADTPLLATMTPQEAINRGLPKPSECDIVLVLFWSRMGTILPHPDYQKPDGSHYLSGTEWEYQDAYAAAQASGLPLLVVYRRTERISLYPDMPDFVERYEQWKRIEEFFASFTNPDGSIRQGYNLYATTDEFRTKIERHIRALIAQLLEQPPPKTAAPPKQPSATKLWEGSPFPGLRAFTEQDAPIFFGRGRETEALIRQVAANRFVAVVGASGSGKSSLVAAGLIPRLRQNVIAGVRQGSRDWLIVSCKPDSDPFQSLAAALMRVIPALMSEPIEFSERRDKLAHALADSPLALVETCEAALSRTAPHTEVLLLIDQFEEIFGLAAAPRRASFFETLVRAAETQRFRVVLTLRADFYHRCLEDRRLAELLRYGSFPLSKPGEIALYEMITRPAERAALVFDDGLPELILEDTGDAPGALALMAYALDELYQNRENDARLTHAAYQAIGGVQGAVGKRAEKTFAALSAPAQAALPAVFDDLVHIDERGIVTRQRTPLSAIAAPDGTELVNGLARAGLLVMDKDQDQPVVEVAHEAIFQSWQRLRDWLATNETFLRWRRSLDVNRSQWERAKRDAGALLRGALLEEALRWLRARETSLDQDEKVYIRASAAPLLGKWQSLYATLGGAVGGFASTLLSNPSSLLAALVGNTALGVLFGLIIANGVYFGRYFGRQRRDFSLPAVILGGAVLGLLFIGILLPDDLSDSARLVLSAAVGALYSTLIYGGVALSRRVDRRVRPLVWVLGALLAGAVIFGAAGGADDALIRHLWLIGIGSAVGLGSAEARYSV